VWILYERVPKNACPFACALGSPHLPCYGWHYKGTVQPLFWPKLSAHKLSDEETDQFYRTAIRIMLVEVKTVIGFEDPAAASAWFHELYSRKASPGDKHLPASRPQQLPLLARSHSAPADKHNVRK
jgi:hypothetical protein